MRLLAIALTAALASHAADARDARQDASDRAQADISVCLAFYTIVADCVRGDDGARAALRRLAATSAQASRAAHLPRSDAQLRFDLNMLDQRMLMGNSCAGLGTLQARYADQCRALTSGAPVP
jgi:hypothetical protein